MADIYVYGEIGDSWSSDGKTAKQFADDLKKANGEDVTIHINSVGGDVFDANAMSELVRAYKGTTTASIEGIAASAASYFALTADKVVMNPSAMIMIHNPYSVCYGTADEMRKSADMLDKIRGTIVNQYVRKTGMDSADIEKMMDAETWLTTSEAYQDGFIDEVTDAEPIAAMLTSDELKRFKSVPTALVEQAKAAGDNAKNIETDDANGEVQGIEPDVDATSRVVCLNGSFLKV